MNAPPSSDQGVPRTRHRRGQRETRGGGHNVKHYVMPHALQPTLDTTAPVSHEGSSYLHNEGDNLSSLTTIDDYG